MDLCIRDDTDQAIEAPKLVLGVSSCLLGNEVRFDGGHRRDDLLLATIGRFVRWVPVCPEVEAGLGVPRETVRLEGDPGGPRIVQTESLHDITEGLRTWAKSRLPDLARHDLDGFVAKKNSPSCGFFDVKVFGADGAASGASRGVFADELTKAYPLLPVEEEGRLRDPAARENFAERIFGYHRLKRVVKPDAGPADLVAFHTVHKLTLMAHDPGGQQELGRIVAEAGAHPFDSLVREYAALFMRTLSAPATRGKHANVLAHAMGFLKSHLDGGEKEDVLELIEAYQRGIVPLAVPVTRLNHHLGRHPVPEWIRVQSYLSPSAGELALRSDV